MSEIAKKMMIPDISTPKGIVSLTIGHLSKITFGMGDTFLGRVVGSKAHMAALGKLDDACLSGDLEATKTAGRECIALVKSMVAYEKQREAIDEPDHRL